MQVVFEKGKSLEYTAVKDFGLNFEDRSIKSVKVKVGESVFYDGDVAKYRKNNGEEVAGRCPSLKSAINAMGWLVLKENKKGSKKADKPEPDRAPQVAASSGHPGDYDAFRGGNFDTFARDSRGDVYVAPHPKMALVKEEERVVRDVHQLTKPENTPKIDSEKLDVSRDQVEVKKGFTVTSSTSVNKETKKDMPLVRRDEMGSESTTPISGIKSVAPKGTKKASFVVDEKTPLTIREDMTKEELDRLKPVEAEESQGAKVVKKIGSTMVVQDVDGITMRKKVSSTEGITFTTGTGNAYQRDVDLTVKVNPGSTPISTAQDEGVVVGKVASIETLDAQAAQKAKERADARKKSAKETQTLMDKEKKPKAPKTEDTNNYMSLLPEDWGKMHWTKKEAFIMSSSNKALILFIQSMETSKAILNACANRLLELK